MIERIVRMSFIPERVDDFIRVFDASKQAISSFDGCLGLRLLRDINNPHIFFTYSLWEGENNLEAYRNSPLFDQTWAQTKVLFNDKPLAWSVSISDHVK